MATDDEDSQSIGPTPGLYSVHWKAPAWFHCDTCSSGLFSGTLSLAFMTQVEVEQSAEGGCRICAGIQKFLLKTLPETLSHATFVQFFPQGLRVSSPSFNPRPFFTVVYKDRIYSCEFFSVSDIPARQGLNSFDKPSSFSDHPFIRPMRIPSGATSSDKAFSTLRRWIIQCDTYHSLCGSTKNTLPYRILEIESLQPVRVRVVEDSSLSERYACLSHQWAESETKSNSLTTQNLELYKAGIPEDKFYPLVRDAITAAFRLDLHFIWIDCYCILQNDVTDWEKEAAKMASIYEQAYLTLSATSSTDGRSMFSVTPPDFQETQITEIDGGAIFARKQLIHPCSAAHDNQENLNGASLTRAWVFQERLLSNRFIHFSTHEIFWECRQSTWCECASGEEFWTHRRAKTARAVRDQSWESIAMQYDRTQLSFEKDRLPALGGVARIYGEAHKKTYLAGLWMEDLPRLLAWRKYSSDDHRRPLHGNAPTWSWVSLPRGYLCFKTRPTKSVRLLTWVRKPPGADIYTGCNRTEITVEGPVLDLSIVPCSGPVWDRCIVARTDDAFLTLATDFDLNPEDPTKYRAVPSGTSCSLLIFSNNEDPPGEKEFCGILLVQVNSTDSDMAVFERIGFLDYHDLRMSYLAGPGRFSNGVGIDSLMNEPKKRPKVSVGWLLRKAERRKVTII